jgi:hypothetical protein
MLTVAKAAAELEISPRKVETEPLTEAQRKMVLDYINSPENLESERKSYLKWARQRGEPSPMEHYRALQKEKRTQTTNALSAKRHAAKLNRTPPWADLNAIKAIYKEARMLTKSTGIKHHVDHEIPLQGKLVSGLHVNQNMRILTATENIKKNNRYEVGP